MIELRVGDVHCTISPSDGGRIAALCVDGTSLLVTSADLDEDGAADPMLTGCYPMAPFAGRVRNGGFVFDGNDYQLALNHPPHAIHGTAFLQQWSVNDVGPHFVEMTCSLGDHWPFGGVAHQRIELAGDHIVCRLGVTADDLAMPAQVGWHPWFLKPTAVQTRFEQMYQRDDTGIPTGALVVPPGGPWDDCFVGPLAPIELHYARDGEVFIVGVESDCDHWVVYDHPLHATCVEPQSGPPDGFNAIAPGAYVRLDPHEVLERSLTIRWKRLPARRDAG